MDDRLLCALALLSACFSPSATGQTQPDPAAAGSGFERVAAVFTERMTAYGIPGGALGVSYRGKTSTRVFGVTSVENPLPVTADTLFQAGSITKTLTGTVAMRLVEAGKLKLDTPVREHLPSFRVKDIAASNAATLRTLLTHMGGWEGDFFDDAGAGDEALARVVARMAALEQIAPIGTIWSYNNAGFLVAGRLIEIATGKPYEMAMEELLIRPLGLRQTFLVPEQVMTRRFAVGHAGRRTRPIVLAPWAIPRALRPAGGLITSVGDLLRYAEFHLGDGVAADGMRLLAAESMRMLHATQTRKQGTDDEMALAWQVSRLGGRRELWHDGATLGQHALLALIPSEQLAVVVLTNSVRGERLIRDVRRAVAEQYLDTTLPALPELAASASTIKEYVGTYSRPFMDVSVTFSGERLMIQTVQKQGFPYPGSPVPPPAPPAPYVLYAKDRLVGVGPVEGERVEFLRRANGTIGWIRVRQRIAARSHEVNSATY